MSRFKYKKCEGCGSKRKHLIKLKSFPFALCLKCFNESFEVSKP